MTTREIFLLRLLAFIFCLCIVVISILWYIRTLSQIEQEHVILKNQISKMQAYATQEQLDPDSITEVQEKIRVLKEGLVSTETGYKKPEEIDIYKFGHEITRMLNEGNLILGQMQIDETKKSIDFEARGTPENILFFLRSIEHTQWYLKVDTFSLDTDERFAAMRFTMRIGYAKIEQ